MGITITAKMQSPQGVGRSGSDDYDGGGAAARRRRAAIHIHADAM